MKSFNMDENQTEFGLTSLFDSSNDCKDSKKDEGQDYYFTSQSDCADHLLQSLRLLDIGYLTGS